MVDYTYRLTHPTLLVPNLPDPNIPIPNIIPMVLQADVTSPRHVFVGGLELFSHWFGETVECVIDDSLPIDSDFDVRTVTH